MTIDEKAAKPIVKPSADLLFKSQRQNSLVDSQSLSQDELDQESDRKLKKTYAKWFIGILIAQLIVMNAIFILQGFSVLAFDEMTLRFYTTSTIAEVFGVIFIIVNNLFPSTKNKH